MQSDPSIDPFRSDRIGSFFWVDLTMWQSQTTCWTVVRVQSAMPLWFLGKFTVASVQVKLNACKCTCLVHTDFREAIISNESHTFVLDTFTASVFNCANLIISKITAMVTAFALLFKNKTIFGAILLCKVSMSAHLPLKSTKLRILRILSTEFPNYFHLLTYGKPLYGRLKLKSVFDPTNIKTTQLPTHYIIK